MMQTMMQAMMQATVMVVSVTPAFCSSHYNIEETLPKIFTFIA
jgi:hypothetical protein